MTVRNANRTDNVNCFVQDRKRILIYVLQAINVFLDDLPEACVFELQSINCVFI